MPVICLLSPLVLAEFDLREELDGQAFERSGLNKLSDRELAYLNQEVANLLGRDVAQAEPELPQGDDRFGLETIKVRVEKLLMSRGPEQIESRLMGEFTGWKGNTRFVLENGQVWQQTDNSRFVSRKMDTPMVTIRRGALGSYLLKVEGYNSSVKVVRIE